MAHMNLNVEQQRPPSSCSTAASSRISPWTLSLSLSAMTAAAVQTLMRMFLQIQLHAALADGCIAPGRAQAVFNASAWCSAISPVELRQYEQFIRAQQTYRRR